MPYITMAAVLATDVDGLSVPPPSYNNHIDRILIYVVGLACFGVGFLVGGSITALIHCVFSRTKNSSHKGKVELYHVDGSKQHGADNGISLLTAKRNSLRYDKSIYVSNSCPDMTSKRISPYAIARFKTDIEQCRDETRGNTIKSETPTELYAKVP